MGQSIELTATALGDVAIFDTDRSITGQDGHDYDSEAAARSGEGFPAALSARLFEAVERIEHVYVLSNDVVVRRSAGWPDDLLEEATEVIRTFFIHYEENRAPEAAARTGAGEGDEAGEEE